MHRVPIIAGAACSMLLLAGTTAAQGYPAKPVRLIVPFPAGGPADTVSRVIGPRLADNLGQQVVIDNRVGANGNMGAEVTAKAPADGYTLMMVVSSFVTNPALYPNLPFDPLRDCGASQYKQAAEVSSRYPRAMHYCFASPMSVISARSSTFCWSRNRRASLLDR